MGWFRRDEATADEGHEAPVQLDLGFRQRPWEVELLVGKLQDEGFRLHLTTQSQIPEMGGGLGPKRCLLLVQPADEPQVRAELSAAGIL